MQIEIPTPDFIQDYLKLQPESEAFSEDQSHIDCVFSTQAKNGNITFKLKSDLKELRHSLSILFYESTDGQTNKSAELNLLSHLGKLLSVLHDSAESFIHLYERANQYQPSDEMSDIEAAIKNAQDNDAA